MIFFMAAFAMPLSAQTQSDIQNQIQATKQQRDQLLAEQARLQKELDNLGAQKQTLQTSVRSLDATRTKLTTDIKITQSKISSANLSISKLENSISSNEEKASADELAIRDAIHNISELDSHSFIIDLMASKNISQAWTDSGQLSDVNDSLRAHIKDLAETKAVLTEQKTLKEQAKQDLVSYSSQLTGQKKVVEATKSAQTQLLTQTKSQEAAYQKMLQNIIAQEKQTESDLYDLESKLNLKVDASSYPAPKHGILSWPLATVKVTQMFGKTVGGEQLYAEGFHNGVDFRASMGTAVMAMHAGVVRGTGNTDLQRGCYSYGRWALIDYGNGLTSVYGHLSALVVKAGDTVTTGQVVGYSGGAPGADGAGYSTGPHLHVGLFASQGVEIQQFTTSKGCKQMMVPMADHRAYLDPLAYLP